MKKIVILHSGTEGNAVNLIRHWAAAQEGLSYQEINISEENSLSQLNSEDLIVIASAMDNMVLSKEILVKVLLHVLDGGTILFLENGTRLQKPYELNLMMGAKWQEAMPYTEQTITFCEMADTETVQDIWEELWLFERSVFDDSKVLAQIRIGSSQYPVIWKRNWYKGQVYCMALSMTDLSQPGYSQALEAIVHKAVWGE